MINCESCNEILHKDNFTSCIICEDREMCNDCIPCEIEFKNNRDGYVCKECICDPLKRVSESTIIDCAKNLKMTKKAFLKVLKDPKICRHNPSMLIDKFKKQIQSHENEIKLLNDKIKFQESPRQ